MKASGTNNLFESLKIPLAGNKLLQYDAYRRIKAKYDEIVAEFKKFTFAVNERDKVL